MYDGDDAGTISDSNIGYVNRIKEYDWINPTFKRSQQTSAQRKQAYDNAIGLEFDEADSAGFETFADE